MNTFFPRRFTSRAAYFSSISLLLLLSFQLPVSAQGLGYQCPVKWGGTCQGRTEYIQDKLDKIGGMQGEYCSDPFKCESVGRFAEILDGECRKSKRNKEKCPNGNDEWDEAKPYCKEIFRATRPVGRITGTTRRTRRSRGGDPCTSKRKRRNLKRHRNTMCQVVEIRKKHLQDELDYLKKFCGDDEDRDSDGDGTPDSTDGCPLDPAKIDPGQCGCFVPDDDSDGDGAPNCVDECPHAETKTVAGPYGCNSEPPVVPPGCSLSGDDDGDGVPNCEDHCPNDPTKSNPGICGCGEDDSLDSDGDGAPDCNDYCPDNPHKWYEGLCGCEGYVPEELLDLPITRLDCEDLPEGEASNI